MDANNQETNIPEANKDLDLSFNLLDMVGSIWRWRKSILILVGIVVIGTIIATLLLPNYYTAAATVIPSNEEKDLFGKDGKNKSIYGDEDAVDRVMIFSKSALLVEFMVKEFDLASLYKINNSTPKGESKVAKRFLKLYNVKKNEFSGIEISVQDTDPERSAKMVQAVLTRIEALYKEATISNKNLILETYEEALRDKKAELGVVSDSLIRLRKKYSIYDVKMQGEMLASMVVSSESQLTEYLAKLEAFKQQGGRQDSIVNISARIRGLQRKLEMLNEQNDSLKSSISLKSYNEGREQVMYFENQIESLNEDISTILTGYSQFKAQANSKAGLIVLEPVQVPKVKSFPVRSLMVIAAIFLALVVGILGALVLDLNKRIDWKAVLKDK
jgi:capsule polysaccharide export protein KpsE/RkpR